jgi:hypothetical protein
MGMKVVGREESEWSMGEKGEGEIVDSRWLH